ncbi:MAG: hypothetical protein M3N43_14905, partial [Actinomycetota bacterium]|nr:hypothetical protein [Actinomycetota bacterium]
MKRWINATKVRRSAVVGVLVCSGLVGLSCSPAGHDSTVSGAPGSSGAAATGSGGIGGAAAGSKNGPDLG